MNFIFFCVIRYDKPRQNTNFLRQAVVGGIMCALSRSFISDITNADKRAPTFPTKANGKGRPTKANRDDVRSTLAAIAWITQDLPSNGGDVSQIGIAV